MDDLIAALTIFRKYGNPEWPTHCEHDIMHVQIEYDEVSEEDQAKLNDLGFIKDEFGTFCSFKFGSA